MAISVYNSNTLLGETGVAALREYIDDVKRYSVHYDLALAASLDCSPIRIVMAGVGGVQIGDFSARGRRRRQQRRDRRARHRRPRAPRLRAHRVSPGTIADADGLTGVAWRYQWLRDGVEIAGATGAAYTPVADDVGARISVAPCTLPTTPATPSAGPRT